MSNALFLDRDGVINRRLPGAYVAHPDEFDFLPGVLEALVLLEPIFRRMVVVTNQAGIGKGLMTQADVDAVHQQMLQTIMEHGGRLDAVFCCPNRADENSILRKPAPGMAWQAQQLFPDIAFEASWMVGDSTSDIEFGQRLGMKTAFITGKTEDHESALNLQPDWTGDSLYDFALWYAQQAGA
jgi:histidinol-phosphate phosphatase family protein